jgi:tripartite-type tricarboxylate transporter receptor subunit TctC
MKKFTTMALALFAAIGMSLFAGGGQQSGSSSSGSTGQYPSKPITLLCGYGAGGSSDMTCRIIADALSKNLGQPVTVLNKPGAGGFVAWTQLVNNTKPDGYTFALINSEPVIAGKYDKANPRKFDYNAMDLLCNAVSDPQVLAIRKDETRYTDFKSLLNYAKTHEVLFSSTSSGIMSGDAGIMVRLNEKFGTKFKGLITTSAKNDQTYLINKSTDFLSGNVGDVVAGLKNGDFKVIVVFSAKRISLIPEVPTCSELGFGDIIADSSRGFALPKGVDPKVKAILLAGLKKAISDPATVKSLTNMGIPINYIEGPAYKKFMDDKLAVIKQVWNIK